MWRTCTSFGRGSQLHNVELFCQNKKGFIHLGLGLLLYIVFKRIAPAGEGHYDRTRQYPHLTGKFVAGRFPLVRKGLDHHIVVFLLSISYGTRANLEHWITGCLMLVRSKKSFISVLAIYSYFLIRSIQWQQTSLTNRFHLSTLCLKFRKFWLLRQEF